MRNRMIVAIALSSMLASYNAAADESAAGAEAREAIAAFVGAVASADVDGLKAILAPEFQLLRATGVGYDREGYIASGLPTIKEWQVEDLVATASDELLVARYQLVVDETIEGVPVARRAPRLTVFRQEGDTELQTVAAARIAIAGGGTEDRVPVRRAAYEPTRRAHPGTTRSAAPGAPGRPARTNESRRSTGAALARIGSVSADRPIVDRMARLPPQLALPAA